MEDPGFQEQLAAVQKKKLLSDKEADFRQYLVRSGGAEELVKLLVGLQEAGSAPADPVAFIQHFFSTQELALVKGRPIDNIMALQEEGARRAAKVAELEEALGEATAKVEAKEAALHAPHVASLLQWYPADDDAAGADDAPAPDDAPPASRLAVGKLYSSVVLRFPAEEGAPWAEASDGGALERPTGLLSAGGVAKWAAATYGFGAAYAKAQPGRTLAELAAAADPEACTAEAPEPVELDVARAVHEACLLLQGAVAAEEEGGDAGEEEEY